jgi:DNA-binding transcriptional ArsR family regulator
MAHAEVFRALGDPTRRALFERLIQGEASVGDLTSGLRVSQPAVSQHLAVLRDAGLVTPRQSGRQRFYRAEPAGLAPLFDWLEHYQRFWKRRLAKLQSMLEEIDDD